MHVKLVSQTTPELPVELGITTAEELLVYTARVSNPSNQGNNDTAPKLIGYLLKNKHWSPFEMIDITIEINVTRDIGRQMLRHLKAFSVQEWSQRYADPTTDLGFEISHARLQDPKNRQNSIATDDTELQEWWSATQNDIVDRAKLAYSAAIQRGIAKEVARKVFPEGLTMSRMYMKGSLRSWITYIAIREKGGTQPEHMDVAKAAKRIICDLCPATAEALGGFDTPWVV